MISTNKQTIQLVKVIEYTGFLEMKKNKNISHLFLMTNTNKQTVSNNKRGSRKARIE
jgi:hypothetical protein